jgi:tRNA-Thr(GGU) m(6)t(6)A37 methyltransferase TsaA
MSDTIAFNPIGIIRSPFRNPEDMPIQTSGALGVEGTIEMDPEYAAGLKDLDGFSHIVLLYHFHRSKGFSLETKPFMDDELRGVFATRAPRRPNPIGLSIVRLNSIEGCILRIQDVDMLDGTPLLDIKPYVPQFDAKPADRIGWLTGKAEAARERRSDSRFESDL